MIMLQMRRPVRRKRRVAGAAPAHVADIAPDPAVEDPEQDPAPGADPDPEIVADPDGPVPGPLHRHDGGHALRRVDGHQEEGRGQGRRRLDVGCDHDLVAGINDHVPGEFVISLFQFYKAIDIGLTLLTCS